MSKKSVEVIWSATADLVVTVPAGSAIFHHQDVWHGSRANTHATRPRRALAVHLLRRDVAFRITPPPDYIYGRYVSRRGSSKVSDTFFPVTWAPSPSAGEPAVRSEAVIELTRCGLIIDDAKGSNSRPSPTLIAAWADADADGSERHVGPRDALTGMLDAWRTHEPSRAAVPHDG